MASYRKKPVIVEAFKFQGNVDYSNGTVPDWFYTAVVKGKIMDNGGHVVINTLEGNMCAVVGDYIIQGVEGEIYPCKTAIFEKTYEEVK